MSDLAYKRFLAIAGNALPTMEAEFALYERAQRFAYSPDGTNVVRRGDELERKAAIFTYSRDLLRELLQAPEAIFVTPEIPDSKISDPKISDPKISDPKIPDPKIPDPKIPDPKIPDPKIPDPKISDPKISDPKIPDPKISDPVPCGYLFEPRQNLSLGSYFEGMAMTNGDIYVGRFISCSPSPRLITGAIGRYNGAGLWHFVQRS